jgi:hypothetical protein
LELNQSHKSEEEIKDNRVSIGMDEELKDSNKLKDIKLTDTNDHYYTI